LVPRQAASATGPCNRFRNGTGFGAACSTFFAPPMMASSTIVTCATTSADDQRPAPGDVRHNSVGTSLAVATNLRRDVRSKSRIGSKLFTEVLWSDRETAGLFKRTRQLQHARFAEVRPQNLHADGQLLFGHSAWNRDARNSSQRARNCIYIS